VPLHTNEAEQRECGATRAHLRRWLVAGVAAAVLMAGLVWVGYRLIGSWGPARGPVVGLSPPRATPADPGPSTDRSVPTGSASGNHADTPQSNRAGPSPVPMPTPPVLIPVPSITVTHVPKGARVMRFEAQAESGSLLEVSISDAVHRRHDYPPQPAPVAFEMPVPSTASNNSAYFTFRVSTPRSAGTPSDVYCRILVDGIVITSEQGQGYVACLISPYYDIRRT
jgi:hypothetical protein